jgi:hypothetical protein
MDRVGSPQRRHLFSKFRHHCGILQS